MTDTHLETITVPKRGSKWEFNNRPITVVRVLVSWQYDDDTLNGDGLTHLTYFGSFADQFTPIEAKFEAGHEYHRNKNGDAIFRVYDVDDLYAYGVYTYTDDGDKEAESVPHKSIEYFTLKGPIS
jgi:hypothetical protein